MLSWSITPTQNGPSGYAPKIPSREGCLSSQKGRLLGTICQHSIGVSCFGGRFGKGEAFSIGYFVIFF